MPSHSASPVGESAKLVHLDCASSDLDLILKLIDKVDCGTLAWTRLAHILQIGERYQFKHIPDLVRQRASDCIRELTAVEIFQFAAVNDYRDLAKLAIIGFAKVNGTYAQTYDKIPLSMLDRVPARYAVSLVVAMAKNPDSIFPTYALRWEQISNAFNCWDNCESLSSLSFASSSLTHRRDERLVGGRIVH